jgi:hypothetical protein
MTFVHLCNPQGFGDNVYYTGQQILTIVVTPTTTSVRPMPQRTPKMDLKIYYYFLKNKLLPQAQQCAFDLESGKFYLG